MADAIVDRVRRYILDGSDADLQRLMGVSEAFAEPARRAFARAGRAEGWTVIDCGCGPMGAIAVLAEMVGPAGRVVGVDFSEAAIGRARSIADALGLENVKLHAGDIHELDPADLGGAVRPGLQPPVPGPSVRSAPDPAPARRTCSGPAA